MIRICLLIPSLQTGGMERVMSELIRYFVYKSRNEVHLILYGNYNEIFYRIPKKVIIHRPFFNINSSNRVIYAIRTFYFLRQKIISLNPHTVLSFGEYWNSFVLLALYGTKYSVFLSDRCQPDKPLGKLHTKFRKWLYPRAKGIIAQTKKAKQIYKHQFTHNNVRVIGNPIGCTDKNFHNINKENIVLSVGRLIPTKQYDT